MTANTDHTAPPPPLAPAPRPPLRRSRSDTVIAGVAGGFGRWLGIDPVIVRVVLVVLAVFGGSGLLLYAIGWLFIPQDGSDTSSADAFFRESRQSGSTARAVLIVVGVVVAVIVGLNLMGWAFGGWGGGGSVLLLLGVGALVLYLVNRPVTPPALTPASAPRAGGPAANVADVADADAAPVAYAYGGSGQYPGYPPTAALPLPPPAPRERSYLGLATLSAALLVTGVLVSLEATDVVDLAPVVVPGTALAILGLGVLVGAWAGRARWLLWFAIPTLLVTIAASFVPAGLAADLRDGIRDGVRDGVGERSWAPTSVMEARTPFELGVGSAQLDLTGLVLPAGVTALPVEASVGIGELVVIVPDDARVVLDATVGLGELQVDGAPRDTGPSPSFAGELPGGPATGPVIDLTLSTDLGSLEVSRA